MAHVLLRELFLRPINFNVKFVFWFFLIGSGVTPFCEDQVVLHIAMILLSLFQTIAIAGVPMARGPWIHLRIHTFLCDLRSVRVFLHHTLKVVADRLFV